jgi:hypothetical protein
MSVSVNDPIRAEADAFVAFIDETDQSRSNLVRVETQDGVAVAFYSRLAAASSDSSKFLGVLLDEEAPGQWAALGAAEIEPGGSRHFTAHPSERGDWIIAIYGSAPGDATVAVVEHDGKEWARPIHDGLYAFVARASIQPETTHSRPRFK